MGRVKEWAADIREQDRRMDDDNRYGHTTYAEAMFWIQRERKQQQQPKPKKDGK